MILYIECMEWRAWKDSSELHGSLRDAMMLKRHIPAIPASPKSFKALMRAPWFYV